MIRFEVRSSQSSSSLLTRLRFFLGLLAELEAVAGVLK